MNYTCYYAACHKDKKILEKSSSGGMFTVFAKNILDRNGIVFGATFDSNQKKVRHVGVSEFSELDKLRKSKYVYSDFKDSITEIERAIEEERYILFTGTPCQAAAIKNKYSWYDKLFVVDLFCHGTLDPSNLNDYLASFRCDITNVCFREQESNNKSNFQFCLYSDDNLVLSDVYINNPLTYMFLNSAGIRDACFECRFAYSKHAADITIGDWDFDYPEEWDSIYENLHPSIVAINNEKGQCLFESCKESFNYCKVGDNENEVDWYYRKHDSMEGLWGYNPEIKQEFKDLMKDKGFDYASKYIMYKKYIVLIERALEKGNKKIAIYGCGVNGKKIFKVIREFYRDRIELQFFVISQRNDKEVKFEGKKIYELDKIYEELLNYTTIISIENEEIRRGIEDSLRERGIYNYVGW